MVCTLYKGPSSEISPETSMTELYSLVFDELKLSEHFRAQDLTEDQVIKVEKKVQKMAYEFTTNKKFIFSEEELALYDLTIEVLESFTFLHIKRNKPSNRITSKDRMIEFRHQSLQVS